jgi:AAA domain-containing protein
VTAEPAFLRRLSAVRDHSTGWCTPCPDTHASSGYSVVISTDDRAGRYRFTCTEAINGELCGNERELIRLLGLDDADVRLNGGIRSIRASDVEMRSIRWLEKPLWQASAFELLAAPKGAGKGTYLAGLASRISRNNNVLFVATEDSAAIDTVPRLAAEGADLDRCHIVEEHPKLPDDIDGLLELALSLGGVGLFVIDPVANHIGNRNSNSDAEVRDDIAPLNKLADDLECLLIGVRHPGKDRSRGAVASILGSTAWVDTPRAVVMIAQDDQDPLLRHIQVVAGNRSLNGSAQAFRIEAVDVPGLDEPITRAVELGASGKSVEDLLARERPESKTSNARTLILDILDDEGAQESDQLDARIASETGLAAKTVKNARTKLKDEGLIKVQPEKDDLGTIVRWNVSRTQAARP